MGVIVKQNGQKLQFDVKSPAQFINLFDGTRSDIGAITALKVELISEEQTNRVLYEFESNGELSSFLVSVNKSSAILLPLSLTGTLQLSDKNYVRVTLEFKGDISASEFSYELVKTYEKTNKPLVVRVEKFSKRVDLDTSFYTMMLLAPEYIKTFESTFTEQDEKGNEVVKNVFYTSSYLHSVKPQGSKMTVIATAPKQKITLETIDGIAEMTVFLLTV